MVSHQGNTHGEALGWISASSRGGVLVPINDGLRPVAVHKDVRTQKVRISRVAPKCLMGATMHGRSRKKRPWPEGERCERTGQHDCREAHNKRGRSLRGAGVKQGAKENAQSDGTATILVADCSPLPFAHGRRFEGVVTHHPQLKQCLDRSNNNGRGKRKEAGVLWREVDGSGISISGRDFRCFLAHELDY